MAFGLNLSEWSLFRVVLTIARLSHCIGCIGLLIQRHKKCWIENPSLLTCVKLIQNSPHNIKLDCLNMRMIRFDFPIQHFWSHWITSIKFYFGHNSDSSLTVQGLTVKLCTYIKLCNFVFFQARLTYFGFENVIEWVCYVTGPVFVFWITSQSSQIFSRQRKWHKKSWAFF